MFSPTISPGPSAVRLFGTGAPASAAREGGPPASPRSCGRRERSSADAVDTSSARVSSPNLVVRFERRGPEVQRYDWAAAARNPRSNMDIKFGVDFTRWTPTMVPSSSSAALGATRA